MILGATTSKCLPTSLNETFYPVSPFNCIATLYESMHSFGAADFLHIMLDRLKSEAERKIKDYFSTNNEDKTGVFIVNGDYSFVLDDAKRYADYSFEVPEVIQYETGNGWCNDVTMSASVFAANSIEEALEMYHSTYRLWAQFHCSSIRNSAYISLFSLGYVNGKIVSICDDLMTLEEGIYHELMHKYVYSADINSNRNSSRKNVSNFLISTIQTVNGKQEYKSDPLVMSVRDMAYVIYALSENEMPSHIAQNRERFNNANIKTKKDFYDILNSSVCHSVIARSNNTLKLLTDFEEGNIVETTTFKKFLLDIDSFSDKHIGSLDDLIFCLISDWGTRTINKFKKELVKRVGVFKQKAYNVAYDGLPDEVKHKITSDYFSI